MSVSIYIYVLIYIYTYTYSSYLEECLRSHVFYVWQKKPCSVFKRIIYIYIHRYIYIYLYKYTYIHTSKSVSDPTFLMFGTSRPCGVSIATPMLCEPFTNSFEPSVNRKTWKAIVNELWCLGGVRACIKKETEKRGHIHSGADIVRALHQQFRAVCEYRKGKGVVKGIWCSGGATRGKS